MKNEPKMDANRLITEVHKRPALWNQRHLSYHNRDVTNRIWMEIAAIFKLPKQVLKTKWKGLRDTFRAEIKKEQVYRKSMYTSNRPTWIHFKSLQFLKEQMLPRPPIWERTDNDATSGGGGGGAQMSSEDSSSGIETSEDPSNRGITLVQERRGCWTMDTTTEDSDRGISDNLEDLEDSESARTGSIVDVDSPKKNNASGACNDATEETVVKLEPEDHYDDDTEECGGSMLRKLTREEVTMGDNNCAVGGNHQHPVDPLEVDRLDDNYHFLMSLLPHIRTLPAERRMLLRMQMQQLVYQEVYGKNRASLTTSLSTRSQDQSS